MPLTDMISLINHVTDQYDAIQAVNEEILKSLPQLDSPLYSDLLPLFNVTKNDISALKHLQIPERKRLLQSGLPFFTLYFQDADLQSSIRRKSHAEIESDLTHLIAMQHSGIDAVGLMRSAPETTQRWISDVNVKIIDLLKALAKTEHPLSKAYFGLTYQETEKLANRAEELHYINGMGLLLKGLPFFTVNPIWTSVNLHKKEAFSDVRGRLAQVYLSNNAPKPKPGKNQKVLMFQDDDRNTLARRMIAVGARAVFLTHYMRMPTEMARNLYHKETGRQPRSGQTPTDHLWFKQTNARRKVGAMLMITYQRWRQVLTFRADNAKMLALYLTYYGYTKGEIEVGVDLDRFELLTQGWMLSPDQFLSGTASNFETSNGLSAEFFVTKCKSCGIPLLTDYGTMATQCRECSNRRA